MDVNKKHWGEIIVIIITTRELTLSKFGTRRRYKKGTPNIIDLRKVPRLMEKTVSNEQKVVFTIITLLDSGPRIERCTPSEYDSTD